MLKIISYNELSPEVRRLICTCSSDGTPWGTRPTIKPVTKQLYVCIKCHKHRIHDAYICIRCTKTFVKNFMHPGFCWKAPVCWECLDDSDWCHHCQEQYPALFREDKYTTKINYGPPDNETLSFLNSL